MAKQKVASLGQNLVHLEQVTVITSCHIDPMDHPLRLN